MDSQPLPGRHTHWQTCHSGRFQYSCSAAFYFSIKLEIDEISTFVLCSHRHILLTCDRLPQLCCTPLIFAFIPFLFPSISSSPVSTVSYPSLSSYSTFLSLSSSFICSIPSSSSSSYASSFPIHSESTALVLSRQHSNPSGQQEDTTALINLASHSCATLASQLAWLEPSVTRTPRPQWPVTGRRRLLLLPSLHDI